VAQLWLFRVAPLIGGALGGILYRWLSEEPSAQVTGVTPPATAGGIHDAVPCAGHRLGHRGPDRRKPRRAQRHVEAPGFGLLQNLGMSLVGPSSAVSCSGFWGSSQGSTRSRSRCGTSRPLVPERCWSSRCSGSGIVPGWWRCAPIKQQKAAMAANRTATSLAGPGALMLSTAGPIGPSMSVTGAEASRAADDEA
jgi:hypothetical protein